MSSLAACSWGERARTVEGEGRPAGALACSATAVHQALGRAVQVGRQRQERRTESRAGGGTEKPPEEGQPP